MLLASPCRVARNLWARIRLRMTRTRTSQHRSSPTAVRQSLSKKTKLPPKRWWTDNCRAVPPAPLRHLCSSLRSYFLFFSFLSPSYFLSVCVCYFFFCRSSFFFFFLPLGRSVFMVPCYVFFSHPTFPSGGCMYLCMGVQQTSTHSHPRHLVHLSASCVHIYTSTHIHALIYAH